MSTYREVSTCLKCESASRRFKLGEGPSRGLLRDCTTSPINRFAALFVSVHFSTNIEAESIEIAGWRHAGLEFPPSSRLLHRSAA